MNDGVFETLQSPVGVVTSESRSVSYGFYTADELRKLSVVQVNSSEQRDALDRPLPGGLYDPAMGPTDHFETCVTCGLDYSLCPGHIGHIDLALPAYAPVLFTEMLKLLKSKCVNCHRFRASAEKLQNLARAAELLGEGRVCDAKAVLDPDPGDRSHELQPRSSGGGGRRAPPLTPHLVCVRRELHSRLFRTLASAKAKCSHCLANSSAYRNEGGYKVFCVPLSARAEAANQMLGGAVAAKASGRSSGRGGGGGGDRGGLDGLGCDGGGGEGGGGEGSTMAQSR